MEVLEKLVASNLFFSSAIPLQSLQGMFLYLFCLCSAGNFTVCCCGFDAAVTAVSAVSVCTLCRSNMACYVVLQTLQSGPSIRDGCGDLDVSMQEKVQLHRCRQMWGNEGYVTAILGPYSSHWYFAATRESQWTRL